MGTIFVFSQPSFGIRDLCCVGPIYERAFENSRRFVVRCNSLKSTIDNVAKFSESNWFNLLPSWRGCIEIWNYNQQLLNCYHSFSNTFDIILMQISYYRRQRYLLACQVWMQNANEIAALLWIVFNWQGFRAHFFRKSTGKIRIIIIIDGNAIKSI